METKTTKLGCISFEDRKDETKTARGMESQEHYVIVKESSDEYLDHLPPNNGTARCIAEEIITILIDSDS